MAGPGYLKCYGQVAGRSEGAIELAEAVVISGGYLPRPQHILVTRLSAGAFVQLDKRAAWLTMLVAGTSHTRCNAPTGDVLWR